MLFRFVVSFALMTALVVALVPQQQSAVHPIGSEQHQSSETENLRKVKEDLLLATTNTVFDWIFGNPEELVLSVHCTIKLI